MAAAELPYSDDVFRRTAERVRDKSTDQTGGKPPPEGVHPKTWHAECLLRHAVGELEAEAVRAGEGGAAAGLRAWLVIVVLFVLAGMAMAVVWLVEWSGARYVSLPILVLGVYALVLVRSVWRGDGR